MKTSTATWRLARGFSRSSTLRRNAWGLFAISCLLMVTFVALQSLTVSSAQRAQRDFGSFDYKLALAGMPAATDRALASGASTAATITAIGPLALLAADTVRSPLKETDWAAEHFAVALLSGRWPAAPGETVVSKKLSRYVVDNKLTLASGHITLTVTGIAQDRFYPDNAECWVAPGTIAILDYPAMAAAGFIENPRSTLYWSGPDPGQIAAEFVNDLGTVNLDTTTTNDGSQRLAAIMKHVGSRSTVLSGPSLGPINLYPLAFTIPSLLLPVAFVVFAILHNQRRLQRKLATLSALGIAPRSAVAATYGAAALVLLPACIAGIVAGAASSPLVRWLLVQLQPRPLGPLPGVLPAGLRIVAAATLAIGLAALVAVAVSSIAELAKRLGHGRYWLTIGIVAAILWALQRMLAAREPFDFMVPIALLTLVCVMFPLRWAQKFFHLPAADPRTALAFRSIGSYPTRAGLATGVIAATVLPALAFTILLATVATATNAMAATVVSAKQLLLTSDSPLPVPQQIRQVVKEALPDVGSVVLTVAGTKDGKVTVKQSGLGAVLGVPSGAAVERLCGTTLTAAAMNALEQGGALEIGDKTGTNSVWLGDQGGDSREVVLPAVVPISCSSDWQLSPRFMMLSDRLRAAGFGESPYGELFFLNDQSQGTAAKNALVAAGFDSRYVKIYHDPKIPIPLAALVSALTLILFGAVAFVTIASAIRRSTTAHLAVLHQLGVPRKWIGAVVRRELMVIVTSAILLAALACLAIFALLMMVLPETKLVVPWAFIAALLATPVLAALVMGLVPLKGGTANFPS